jgi:hypothetical protein
MSRLLGAVVLLAGAAASLVFVVAGGVSSTGAARSQRGGAFAWLHPGPAPAAWRQIRLASGAATLSVPPTWVDLPGDKGTATVAPPGPAGYLSGYLNLTPRQGAERPHGFARFRVNHLADEGSLNARIVSSAENLRLRGGSGSCVIDDYDSRVGHHRYREIACIGVGARATAVVVAAAPLAQWRQRAPLLERAVSYARFA